jgi:hypothetical protein
VHHILELPRRKTRATNWTRRFILGWLSLAVSGCIACKNINHQMAHQSSGGAVCACVCVHAGSEA